MFLPGSAREVVSPKSLLANRLECIPDGSLFSIRSPKAVRTTPTWNRLWQLGIRVLGLCEAIQARLEPKQQTPLRYHVVRDRSAAPDLNLFRFETDEIWGHFDIRSNDSPTLEHLRPRFRGPAQNVYVAVSLGT
jgi:hypothetical protein